MEESPSISEIDWIRRAQAGDRGAFAHLVNLHLGTLMRWACGLSRDHHQAEDAVQETLVEAWKGLSRFDGRCRFSTWLYGILRHRLFKEYRAEARHAAEPIEAAQELPADSSYGLPGRRLEEAEDASRLRQALESLTPEHRYVLELRFFADASLDEISNVLGIPLGTVKSRLYHGLEKMRQSSLSLNLWEQRRESSGRST